MICFVQKVPRAISLAFCNSAIKHWKPMTSTFLAKRLLVSLSRLSSDFKDVPLSSAICPRICARHTYLRFKISRSSHIRFFETFTRYFFKQKGYEHFANCSVSIWFLLCWQNKAPEAGLFKFQLSLAFARVFITKNLSQVKNFRFCIYNFPSQNQLFFLLPDIALIVFGLKATHPKIIAFNAPKNILVCVDPYRSLSSSSSSIIISFGATRSLIFNIFCNARLCSSRKSRNFAAR